MDLFLELLIGVLSFAGVNFVTVFLNLLGLQDPFGTQNLFGLGSLFGF